MVKQQFLRVPQNFNGLKGFFQGWVKFKDFHGFQGFVATLSKTFWPVDILLFSSIKGSTFPLMGKCFHLVGKLVSAKKCVSTRGMINLSTEKQTKSLN